MPKLIINDVEFSGTGATTAKQLSYDNNNSGLVATNTQEAIDELDVKIDTQHTQIEEHDIKIAENASNITNNTTAIDELNSDIANLPIGQQVNDFNSAPLGWSIGDKNALNNPFPNFWTSVFTKADSSSSFYFQQLAISWSISHDKKFAVRIKDQGEWQEWQYLATTDDIDKITADLANKVTNNFTANRVLVSNSSGKVSASSAITTTELGYLDGVTSKIQTQFNNINKAATVKSQAVSVNFNNYPFNINLKRSGNIVTMSSMSVFNFTESNLGKANQLSGLIPSGYRPISYEFTHVVGVCNNVETGRIRFVVDASGNITILPLTTSGLQECYISMTWITSDAIS